MATSSKTPDNFIEPVDRDGYPISRLLRGVGIRSRDDLARLDKRNGPKGISGIGPVRMGKLRKALKGPEQWLYLFGSLLPWATPMTDRQPVSEVVYHDCGLALERYRMEAGKWGHAEATFYYPLNPKTLKPYDIPIDHITQCPLCSGYLFPGSVDVVAPEPPQEQALPPDVVEGELTEAGKAEASRASAGGGGKPGKAE